MNLKSTKRIIEKDIELLSKQYAKGRIYMQGIMREQKKILEKCQADKEKINAPIEKLRKKLRPYIDGKEQDGAYDEMKARYENLLIMRSNLEKAIQVADESIQQATLMLVDGQ